MNTRTTMSSPFFRTRSTSKNAHFHDQESASEAAGVDQLGTTEQKSSWIDKHAERGDESSPLSRTSSGSGFFRRSPSSTSSSTGSSGSSWNPFPRARPFIVQSAESRSIERQATLAQEMQALRETRRLQRQLQREEAGQAQAQASATDETVGTPGSQGTSPTSRSWRLFPTGTRTRSSQVVPAPSSFVEVQPSPPLENGNGQLGQPLVSPSPAGSDDHSATAGVLSEQQPAGVLDQLAASSPALPLPAHVQMEPTKNGKLHHPFHELPDQIAQGVQDASGAEVEVSSAVWLEKGQRSYVDADQQSGPVVDLSSTNGKNSNPIFAESNDDKQSVFSDKARLDEDANPGAASSDAAGMDHPLLAGQKSSSWAEKPSEALALSAAAQAMPISQHEDENASSSKNLAASSTSSPTRPRRLRKNASKKKGSSSDKNQGGPATSKLGAGVAEGKDNPSKMNYPALDWLQLSTGFGASSDLFHETDATRITRLQLMVSAHTQAILVLEDAEHAAADVANFQAATLAHLDAQPAPQLDAAFRTMLDHSVRKAAWRVKVAAKAVKPFEQMLHNEAAVYGDPAIGEKLARISDPRLVEFVVADKNHNSVLEYDECPSVVRTVAGSGSGTSAESLQGEGISQEEFLHVVTSGGRGAGDASGTLGNVESSLLEMQPRNDNTVRALARGQAGPACWEDNSSTTTGSSSPSSSLIRRSFSSPLSSTVRAISSVATYTQRAARGFFEDSPETQQLKDERLAQQLSQRSPYHDGLGGVLTPGRHTWQAANDNAGRDTERIVQTQRARAGSRSRGRPPGM
ncbi:unnamed protein product [Amoebophrya sp. A120]|nr:unnamed protein product [Amoebophrya sp. A120]|eukprot:GSA120T00012472001.1